jgi:thiamine-monophosphate kinase
MTAIRLGPGREFDRIRAIATALGDSIAEIGDDTATLVEGEGALVVSTDASVEGVHFRRDWLTLREIGWRATASALSDLAACAATPAGVLAAVVVPNGSSEAELVELMAGVGMASARAGARVIGGDLSAGAQWMVAITVLGRAVRSISRAGARAGDGIWVTGSLGGARAALDAWNAGLEPDAGARTAFAHPVPRLSEGRWLAEHGATAMMDLSDGLGGDAPHLAAASDVALDIELERLPLHPSVSDAAPRAGAPPELFAASAGEDYELLVTLPAAFDLQAEFRREMDLGLTQIGVVRPGVGVHASLGGTVQVIHGFRHAL